MTKKSKNIINKFYKGLNQESIHEAVISLEERKHQNFEHGEVYFQGDLSSEEQQDLNLSKSDGLFIINEDNKVWSNCPFTTYCPIFSI